MLTSPLYGADEAHVDRFVRDHPFALVVSGAGAALTATPLPLMLERDEDGNRRLIGHFGRANPQIAQLRSAPDALAVFQGPHGYISPSWMRDRSQAPTWNFMMVQFGIEIAFPEGRDAAIAAVDRLSHKMEEHRPGRWRPEDMGARHAALVRGVTPFIATVRSVSVKFKLGQNERPDVLSDILDGLGGEPGVPPPAALRAAMIEANAGRLD